MMRSVRVNIIAAFLCVPCAAATVVNDATTEVPFSFEKGLVVVKASINKDILVDVVTATSAPWYMRPGFIAGIPAVPWIMPCLLGVVLLRSAENEQRVTEAA